MQQLTTSAGSSGCFFLMAMVLIAPVWAMPAFCRQRHGWCSDHQLSTLSCLLAFQLAMKRLDSPKLCTIQAISCIGWRIGWHASNFSYKMASYVGDKFGQADHDKLVILQPFMSVAHTSAKAVQLSELQAWLHCCLLLDLFACCLMRAPGLS